VTNFLQRSCSAIRNVSSPGYSEVAGTERKLCLSNKKLSPVMMRLPSIILKEMPVIIMAMNKIVKGKVDPLG